MLVERVRAAINLRFPGQLKPRVLFVDRGAGFYFARTGKATAGFGAALREHNAKLRGLDGRTRRRRGRRTQTKETGGPADDRRTGAQTETRTDREVDGQTEAQVADHVS